LSDRSDPSDVSDSVESGQEHPYSLELMT
jgi:hypothetical protein